VLRTLAKPINFNFTTESEESMKQTAKQTQAQRASSAASLAKEVQPNQFSALSLEEAKAILTEMLTMDEAFYPSDLIGIIQTLAGLERKTARLWGAELAAHIEKVNAEDEAEFAQMKARIEQTEVLMASPAAKIRAAYEQLAEGMRAVLVLDSTDAKTKNLLNETAAEIWNTSASEDMPTTVHWQLLHVGDYKARHAQQS